MDQLEVQCPAQGHLSRCGGSAAYYSFTKHIPAVQADTTSQHHMLTLEILNVL